MDAASKRKAQAYVGMLVDPRGEAKDTIAGLYPIAKPIGWEAPERAPPPARRDGEWARAHLLRLLEDKPADELNGMLERIYAKWTVAGPAQFYGSLLTWTMSWDDLDPLLKATLLITLKNASSPICLMCLDSLFG